MARSDGGKMSTMVWFGAAENDERKRLGVTHYQCWLRGLRAYQGDKLGGVGVEAEGIPDVPPCTAVLSLGPNGMSIEQTDTAA